MLFRSDARAKKESATLKEKLLDEKLAKADQEASDLAKEKLRQFDEQQSLNKKSSELYALEKDLTERKDKLLTALGMR